MKITFKPATAGDDPNVLDITFSDLGGQFAIEITGTSKEETDSLKGELQALRRGYEAGSESYKKHFTIEYNDKKTAVRMVGNIYNALIIMREQGVLSENLLSLIDSDSDVQKCLEQSKSFITPAKKSPGISFDFGSTVSVATTTAEEKSKTSPPVELKATNDPYKDFCKRLTKQSPTELDASLKRLAEDIKELFHYELTITKLPPPPLNIKSSKS